MTSSLRRCLLLLVFALCVSGGTAAIAAGDEAIAVIVHPSTRITTLSADQLDAIFRLSQREWPTGQAVIAFNHLPGSPLRTAFVCTDVSAFTTNPDVTHVCFKR